MEVNPVLKKVLEGLDFVNWYHTLSENYQTDPAFTDFSTAEAQDMLIEFGFARTTYNPKTTTYILENSEGNRIAKGLNAGLEVSLEGGVVDVVMIFSTDPTTHTGATFSKLGDVKKPQFSNYKELYSLLKKTFDMYSNIRSKMIEVCVPKAAPLALAK
ncbi:hypothetical protein GFS24_09540 [Chitinophaga sp. SYP-B3965]|uniref:hypothetical protein n=1 Tax=Chitinophaga sp. SYP-B3965 TaxID=2663120 RepID=UPI001299EA03|nr:hypothetical protein [Chitinophaga sp. SYP-B3965]MRG45358.1 hypothetical protein [Chitinophaga sp. SYP-B3965]